MDQVKQEQIRILHRLSPPTYILSYVVAMLFVFAFWGLMDSTFLLLWTAVVTLTTLIRAALGVVFLGSLKFQENPDFWAIVYCVGTFIAGVNWALLALQFDATWPSVYQVILFVTLAGLIAGAVGSHSCYFPALACFFAPILVAVIWISTQQSDTTHLWLVPLILTFWIIIHTAGQRFSKMLKANIRFQQSLAVANEKLELVSRLDSLTQLQNRGAMERYLSELWPNYSELNQPVAIAMIDVDMFKAYNDHYGHVEGDRCLMQIAQILKLVIPDELGFVGRYGGEEFIVILPGLTSGDATEILGLLEERLARERIEHKRSTVANSITVSMGVESAVPSSGESWMALIDRADAKLYVAKQRGRAQIVA